MQFRPIHFCNLAQSYKGKSIFRSLTCFFSARSGMPYLEMCGNPNLCAGIPQGRILKMGFFVPMFQLVTPRLGPILTLGASYEQTWKRSTRRCYIPNIKALALTVWDKKIFKNFLLYLYVKSGNPQRKTNFYSRAIICNILVEGH